MAVAMFYHVTRSSVEATLPAILARALAQGWRAAVLGTDAARLGWLDERLWTEGEESFLPHGLAGGPFDAEQPVLLTAERVFPNGPQVLVAIDGAEVAAADCDGRERVCILFNGNDPGEVAAARAQWAALTGAGIAAQYWSEETGRWAMKAGKAESAGA